MSAAPLAGQPQRLPMMERAGLGCYDTDGWDVRGFLPQPRRLTLTVPAASFPFGLLQSAWADQEPRMARKNAGGWVCDSGAAATADQELVIGNRPHEGHLGVGRRVSGLFLLSFSNTLICHFCLGT
jgi:hypothetical protein